MHAGLVLTCTPIVLLLVGFGMWDSLTCDEVYRENGDEITQGLWVDGSRVWGDLPTTVVIDRSPECGDAAASFTLIAGGALIFAAFGVAQASNRGWLTVVSLPVLAVIIIVWAAVASESKSASDTIPLGGISSDRSLGVIGHPSPMLILPALALCVSSSHGLLLRLWLVSEMVGGHDNRACRDPSAVSNDYSSAGQ